MHVSTENTPSEVTTPSQNRVLWGAFTAIGLGIVAIGAVFMLLPRHERAHEIISPLSQDAVLGAVQLETVKDIHTVDHYPPNAYFPKRLIPTYQDTLDIPAKAYAVMDRDSGELLMARNLTTEMPIASVTKIMTTLVALEGVALDTEIQVSSSAASIGEATMGLSAGELVTVEDLLYGMMLPSGNDAAETITNVYGYATYMLKMNEKAKSLGMLDTYFFNPSGLDGESIQKTNFSTPLDLLALTSYALNNQKFADIAKSHDHEIPYIEGKHKYFHLYNILLLDYAYPGVKGVKPGVTDFAGETLVSYAERGGKRLIVVLLGAQYTKDEVIKIYNHVFQKLGVNLN